MTPFREETGKPERQKDRKTDTNKQTEMKEVERITNDEEICTHEIKEERKKS
jgi:hypothetical protein